MARPVEYKLEDVLDRALHAFWNMGYAGCSFQVLTTETGMSRQSIYNTFGDKDGLFGAVIAHYKAKVTQQLLPLYKPTADIEDIRAFVKSSLQVQQHVGPGACFLVITAFGPRAREEKIQAAIEEGAVLVKSAFERVLAQQPSLSTNPEEAAAFLYCAMNGMSALIQTGGQSAQAEAALDHVFQSINLK